MIVWLIVSMITLLYDCMNASTASLFFPIARLIVSMIAILYDCMNVSPN